MLPLQEAWVQSLVRELRSHKLCSAAKNNNSSSNNTNGNTSYLMELWASQLMLVVRNPPANAGDIRDTGSVPVSRRSPGRGNSNPLQYSCLENPMDRGAWQAIVHGHKESDMNEQLSTHTL